MKRRGAVLLGVFSLLLAAPAFADDPGVDFSDQFTSPVPRQQGGVCHIYSSVGLFEAACYRKTGVKVAVSEAVLFAQHLEARWTGPLDEKTVTHYDEVINGRLTHVTYTLTDSQATAQLLPDQPLNITGMDGGDLRDDIKRILAGQDCVTRADLPFDSNFMGTITDIINKYGPTEAQELDAAYKASKAGTLTDAEAYQRQREARHRARDAAVAELRTRLANYLAGTAPLNPAIERCTKLSMKLNELGQTNADQLKASLKSLQMPLMCDINDFIYYDSSGKISARGGHDLLVIGYKETGGKTEFLVRDSNRPQPYYTTQVQGCDLTYSLD